MGKNMKAFPQPAQGQDLTHGEMKSSHSLVFRHNVAVLLLGRLDFQPQALAGGSPGPGARALVLLRGRWSPELRCPKPARPRLWVRRPLQQLLGVGLTLYVLHPNAILL